MKIAKQFLFALMLALTVFCTTGAALADNHQPNVGAFSIGGPNQATSCGSGTKDFKWLVCFTIDSINSIIAVIFAFGVVFVIYAAFQLTKEEEKNRKEIQLRITYGIIGLFIMISVWGLINIFKNTFELDSTRVTPSTIQLP